MAEIKVDYKQLFAVANDETIIALMKGSEAFAASPEFEEIVKKRMDLRNKAAVLALFNKLEINESDWEPCMLDKRFYIRYVQHLAKRRIVITRLYDIYAVSAYMLEKSHPGCSQEDLYALAINNLPPLRLTFATTASYKKHLGNTAIDAAAAQRFIASPNNFAGNDNKVTEEDYKNQLLMPHCPFLCKYSHYEFIRPNLGKYREVMQKYINNEYTCGHDGFFYAPSKVRAKIEIIYFKPLGGSRFKRCETYVRDGELYYRDPDELPRAALNQHLERMLLEKL